MDLMPFRSRAATVRERAARGLTSAPLPLSRRNLLALGLGGFAATLRGQQLNPDLPLRDYEPHSALTVPSAKVERARFPVIDMHAHMTFPARREEGEPDRGQRRFNAPAEELLEVMDRRNLRMLVNLTGGYDAGLADSIATLDRAHPGRFLSFTEPWFSRAEEPGYARFQAEEIERARKQGAGGLKILKTLGVYLRAQETGKLITIDDPRFDPMWDACGQLGVPVAIHTADPVAFFDPIDSHNERFEELVNHPDWSFHGPDFPKRQELIDARNRVIAKHAKTQFLGLHVGNSSENLSYAGECLDRYPNLSVEFGARIGELGRQPRESRKFFDKYQDRILFGTDATPNGVQYPQQLFGDLLYQIYFRFLETEDEYFDYAPAAVPPQGRWKIYGLGLPEGILRKVYHQNAERLLAASL
jgi:predicted TIM-barrel fold metal-dependent hydrolase